MTPNLAISPFAKSSATRTRWIPQVGSQLRANYERLLRDLKLLARARSEGVHDRPPTQATDLDVAQHEALNAVDAGGNLLRQFLDSRLAEAKDLIGLRTPKLLDADAAKADAELSLRRAELSDAERLGDLWKAQERTHRQMSAFKRTNGLDREPMYADDVLKAWSLMIWLWIGESIVNAGAFGLAGGGLIGGYLLASMFALANLGVGLLTGTFGLRLLWHVSTPVRLLGVLFTCAGVLLGMWVNLTAATYREVLQSGVSDEIATAFRKSASIETIGELSATSIGLLLLGLVFFVLALQKGAGGEDSPHDPYLKYRAYARPWRRACAAYSAAKLASLDGMKAAVAAAQNLVRARLQDEAGKVTEALDIAEQAVQRADEISDSIMEWKDMGSTLLSAYRNENLAVRTAPEPAYFATFPDLRAMLKGLPDGSEARKLAAGAADIHQKNMDAAAGLNRELADMLAARLDAFGAAVDAIESRARRDLEPYAAPAPAPKGPTVTAAPQPQA